MTKKNDIMQTTSYSIRPSTKEMLKQHKEEKEQTWDEYFKEVVKKAKENENETRN